MKGNLPINWFDVLVVVLLFVGVVRGRKRGMSEELLDLFKWLAIVVVAALLYKPVGNVLARFTNLSVLIAYLISYGVIAIGLHLFVAFIKNLVGEKLVESDVFGRLEYYLGMGAGGVRFACMILVALALLNARYFSADELAAIAKVQRDNFGTISFPTLGSLQQDVFQGSTTGYYTRKYLNEQLIEPTLPGTKLEKRVGIGQRRQRSIDEVLGTRK